VLSLVAILCLSTSTGTALAQVGDVLTEWDEVAVKHCPGRAHAGQTAFVQTRITDGGWVNRQKVTVGKNGCVATRTYPADLVPPGVGQVAVRLAAAAQKVKGRALPGWRSSETGYRVWPEPTSAREPVPHLDAFAAKYGNSVATIICTGPYGGGQGTGVSVPVTMHPSTQVALPGSNVYLATAGHVVKPCFYSNHNSVTVLYQGQAYPGRGWYSQDNPDIGAVITTAPVPPAAMALGSGTRPQIGDVAVAIGTATGVVDTTTQGTINGVSDSELNTTVPSGHGASGGPMFNNRGQVVGLVVAGNGSLTVATSLPAFCGTVYSREWCAAAIWP
jgi:hypothetical protein